MSSLILGAIIFIRIFDIFPTIFRKDNINRPVKEDREKEGKIAMRIQLFSSGKREVKAQVDR